MRVAVVVSAALLLAACRAAPQQGLKRQNRHIRSKKYMSEEDVEAAKARGQRKREERAAVGERESSSSSSGGTGLGGVWCYTPDNDGMATDMNMYFVCDAPRFTGCYSEYGVEPPVSKDAWDAAVREAFPDQAEVMLREEQGVSEFPQEFTVPDEGLKGPGHRAISVANLERVLEFFKALERKSPDGKIVNRQCNPAYNPLETSPNYVPVEEITMNYVNAYLVMPSTRFAGTSFASLVRKEGADIRPHHFVSHNWKGSYQHFVESVLSHYKRFYEGRADAPSKEDTYYWVCTFANNQHRVQEELGGKIDEGPFAVAISDAKARHGQVVAVQDDSKPNQYTLSRVWCVFEMEFSLLEQMPIVFSCDSGALIERGAYVDDKTCRCEWVNKMKDWSFENACESPKASCASSPDDIKKISKYIEENPVPTTGANSCSGGKDCLGQAVRGFVSGVKCTSHARRPSLDAYAQAHGGVIPLSGPADAATAAGRARRVDSWRSHVETLKGGANAKDQAQPAAVADPSCSGLVETKSCMGNADDASCVGSFQLHENFRTHAVTVHRCKWVAARGVCTRPPEEGC